MMTQPTDQNPQPPAPAPRRRRLTRGRRILLRALLLAAAILGPLLAAEAALRVAGFHYQLYPEKVEFGWPTAKDIVDMFDQDPELYWVRRDYRDNLAKARERRPDLVFMGDSCTQIGTYDKLLTGQLAPALPGLAWINVGTAGYSSYQGLQQFRRDIAPLRPAVVTFFYGWNDHWMGFGIADKDIAHLNDAILYRLRHVRLVQLLTRAMVALSVRQHGKVLYRVSEEDFRANLRQIVAIAKANGITPVLLTAPTWHVRGQEPEVLRLRQLANLEELVPLHERYEQIVRDVARDEGVTLCDLSTEFRKLPMKDLKEKYFLPGAGIHLTPEGDQVIARIMLDCFRQHGILDLLARSARERAAAPARQDAKPK